MAEEKRRVNAAIDKVLYENVMKLGFTISEAITLGLEKLLEANKEDTESPHTNTPGNESSLNPGLVAALNDRIESLEEQIKVKDNQLEKKDSQIQNLTESVQSQALNIHNLINQKAIEAPGSKRPWWRFW